MERRCLGEKRSDSCELDMLQGEYANLSHVAFVTFDVYQDLRANYGVLEVVP